MRWIALLLLTGVLLATAACNGEGGGEGVPTATVRAGAATGIPSAPSETFGEEGFRQFAPLLQDALEQHDMAFLSDRAQRRPVVCTKEDVAGRLGGPRCEFEGQSYDGFGFTYWGSVGAIVPIEEALAEFERLFSDALPAATDEFGDGAVRLHALNVGGDRYDAIMTAIIERPEDVAGEGPLRVAIGTSWAGIGGRWMMTGMLVALEGAEDLLAPNEQVRAIVYPHWELYEAP
jgi:hypothetical protein